MKQKYRKKINLVNNTGYTPGYSSEKNPVNYIPSENITMKNTPYPVYGEPLDKDGQPIGKKVLMQPGGEYFFEGATYVKETPQDQNEEINNKKTKEMKKYKYQFGGKPKEENLTFGQPENLPSFPTFNDVYGGNNKGNVGSINPQINFNMDSPDLSDYQQNQMSEQDKKIQELTGRYQTTGTVATPEQKSYEESGKTNTAQVDSQGKPLYQFSNPYGEMDLGMSLTGLGQSIGNKDVGGALTYGANSLLKGAKSFMQGMGTANRKNQNMNTFYGNFRKNMTGEDRATTLEEGGYFQEGGEQGISPEQIMQMLQQGAQPEELLQKMIEAGVPEEEATQIIQQAMQQETPQLQEEQMQYAEGGLAKGGTKAVQEYQKMLNKELNINLDPDGAWGPNTQKAYEQYQEAEKRKGYKTNFQNDSPSFSPVVKERRKEDYSNKPTVKIKQAEEMFNFGQPQLSPFNMMSFGKREEGRGSVGDSYPQIRESLKSQSQESLYEDYVSSGMSSKEALKAINMATDPRKMFQEGGEQMQMQEQAPQQDMGQITQQVAEALQQGAQPEQILQKLIESGIPQEQAVQIIEDIMQQMQGQQPEEQQMMKMGGMYLKKMQGKKIKDYKFNEKTNSYDVEFE